MFEEAWVSDEVSSQESLRRGLVMKFPSTPGLLSKFLESPDLGFRV